MGPDVAHAYWHSPAVLNRMCNNTGLTTHLASASHPHDGHPGSSSRTGPNPNAPLDPVPAPEPPPHPCTRPAPLPLAPRSRPLPTATHPLT